MIPSTKNILFLTFGLIAVITLIGLPLDIMAPDAALYASISKEIHLNNDFVNLYVKGKDWLDKPHLPFWLTAISFKIFGVTNFAYKLPGVLIFFFGCWVTYKFTKENYNKETAILATIILLTSLHSVVSNFDVRAEPFLTGFIIAGVYWFYKYIKNKTFKDLLIASLFCALAVMTKGIFALIPVIAAVGGSFLVKRQWKEIINPMWLVALVLILVFITPELYTLYQQFDLHPEKVVFGKTNVSGIRFFFWDSQFGRFFNDGPIRGSGDITFFLHTILWAFLPWSVLFYIGSFLKIKRNLKKVNRNEEFYSIFAALTAILMFSLSKFQLAHYTNIVFPFMAIITADFIVKLKTKYQKLQKTYSVTQWILIAISLIIMPVLFIVMELDFNLLFLLIIPFLGFIIWRIFSSEKSKIEKLFYYTTVSFCLLYGFMMTCFYPTLLKYQGDVAVAKLLNKNYTETIHYISDNLGYGFDFYNNTPALKTNVKDLKNYQNKLFYLTDKGIVIFKKHNIPYTIEKEFNNFSITRLNGKFINKNTRNSVLNKHFLVRLN